MGINNSLNYQPVQYNVVVGAANNAIANVAPSSTSGYPLVSQGASSNPTFAQATVPGGGTGTGSFVAYTPVTGGTTTTGALQSVASAGTSGQALLSAGASSLPAYGNLLVPAGGTGDTSFVAYTPICGGTTTTGALQAVASAGSSGQALISGGAGALPAYGVLGIAGGGTNASSFTQSNGIVTYNGTSLVNYAGPQINSSGRMTNTAQPCFLATVGTTITNATGNGAVYQLGTSALTIVFDNSSSMNTNGTFTAPVTGRYLFNFVAAISNCTAASIAYLSIDATSGDYYFHTSRAGTSADWGWAYSTIINMSSADTATFYVQVSGESTNKNSITGISTATAPITYLSGHLVC